jgi:putative ABC transport system permease protein
VKAINRKLLRDLARSKAQIFSIAAVVACGVASVIAMRSTLDSMQQARDHYYASSRFPNVFASLKRAPERLAARVAEIDGVAAVETRVAADALLRVPRLAESATGHFVSVPEDGQPLLSTLYIRRGRFLTPRSDEEVLINEHFAEANDIGPGDTLSAVINGRWRELLIVGVALSPEFVHDAVPSAGLGMFGDSRHVGILWMRRNALGPLYDMDGAFNDVTLLLSSRANEQHVIAELDRLLLPYGGGHAYGRKDQLSNNIVSGEIEQLRVFGTAMPVIFLSVAAFLLNVVLSRLVATQREEIAALKAFGYRNSTIAAHFLGYPAAAIIVGSIGGIALGVWVGSKYTMLYRQFFRFPVLEHHTSLTLILVAVLVSGAAAVMGALAGVRAAVSLPPAEGMRPPSPAVFKRLWAERLGVEAIFSPAMRMIMRNLERRPLRTMASVVGVALAAAILVVGTFAFDSAGYMADIQFRNVEREDLTVSFTQPRPARASRELAHIDGVTRVEPYRITPVRISSGHRSRQIIITGLNTGGELRRIVDRDSRRYALPQSGIVLTSALGQILHVKAGDSVSLELLEKGSTVRHEVVAALADELIGLSGYMEIGALNRMIGEGKVITGAYLSIAPGAEGSVQQRLGELPGVGGTATRQAMLESFDEQIAESLRLTVMIVVSLASVVALGVIYNGIRIALSERSRELASLRVLGFTRREVASLLFGEQAVINLFGTPLGLLMGFGLAFWIAVGFKTELYRFPVVVLPHTYLFSAIVILIAGVLAALMMRRRIYNLNLVSVLKTRE